MDDAEAGRFDTHDDFPSAFLDNRRTLTVWLPPGYEGSGDHYPVLYLHDGQNVFDAARSASGVSWDAHVTAASLIRAGRLRPLILVGIDNTPQRLDEYAVHRDAAEKAGGRGESYARFVLDEVKPFVDANYRTLPDRRHTAVAGSSMGGLISLTMARLHPERFALCGAVSPSLWWARCRELRDAEADQAWLSRKRFWVDMGTREGGGGRDRAAVGRARRLVASFRAAGLVQGRDFYYWEVAGGEHHEAAWAARFDNMLLFFFGHRPAQ